MGKAYTYHSRYWNNEVPEWSKYSDQLMPASDNANTLEGELIRAGSRIAYDHYNNGSLNNTSGAVNFLYKYMKEEIDNSDIEWDTFKEMGPIGEYIENHMDTQTIRKFEEDVDILLDMILARVKAADPNFTPNIDNMFNYQDKTVYIECFDDDSWDDDSWDD